MQKNKKIILVILLAIFFVIIILAFILGSRVKDDNNKINETLEEKDRFGMVNEYEEFFTIQTTINDIENIEMDSSYFVKEIYINTKAKTYYYFIKCVKFSEFEEPTNRYLLLILDKNTNSYDLTEINETIKDIQSYAKNYNIIEKNINNTNKILEGNYSDKNILTIYLEYFKKLLIKDSYAAYNMLHEDTRNKYVDYNNFDANVINIYETLSSGIFSISVKEKTEENVKTYSFEDNNRNKIVIYEEGIMNFKISY